MRLDRQGRITKVDGEAGSGEVGGGELRDEDSNC
jgi:hypothetical protein